MSQQKPRKLWVYISGPYSSNPTQNVNTVLNLADTIQGMGAVPIIPHLFMLWDVVMPKPYEFWISLCLELIRRCDVVYRLPGISKGADREVTEATNIHVPIVYNFSVLKRVIDGYNSEGRTHENIRVDGGDSKE